jgi:hypothetical protein
MTTYAEQLSSYSSPISQIKTAPTATSPVAIQLVAAARASFRQWLEGMLFERNFRFINPIEINRYLEAHEELIPVLIETYHQLRGFFHSSISELWLEYDCDEEEIFEGLFMILKTPMSAEESLQALKQFDRTWWLNLEKQIRNSLTVIVRPL